FTGEIGWVEDLLELEVNAVYMDDDDDDDDGDVDGGLRRNCGLGSKGPVMFEVNVNTIPGKPVQLVKGVQEFAKDFIFKRKAGVMKDVKVLFERVFIGNDLIEKATANGSGFSSYFCFETLGEFIIIFDYQSF
ncbi:hypothetical protein HDU76_010608, partial [Blyttiomyces sp. JEL0837]